MIQTYQRKLLSNKIVDDRSFSVGHSGDGGGGGGWGLKDTESSMHVKYQKVHVLYLKL